MEEIVLVAPALCHKLQAVQYILEFRQEGMGIAGGAGIDEYEYEDWLAKLQRESRKETCSPGRVPAATFFIVRSLDDRIVGMIDIRHELNEFLTLYGGHIGYSIRASERRKGYAGKALSLALAFLRQMGIENVLVTCDKVNIASAKTIQRNGGILENEVIESSGTLVQRYWISTK